MLLLEDLLNPDYRSAREAFNHGFDACMELDLPVKFAEWMVNDSWSGDYEEGFTYWLENVYKNEGK